MYVNCNQLALVHLNTFRNQCVKSTRTTFYKSTELKATLCGFTLTRIRQTPQPLDSFRFREALH